MSSTQADNWMIDYTIWVNMAEMEHQWKLMLAEVLCYYWGSKGVMRFLEVNQKVWRPRKVR